ncbi:MAG TPA: aldose 1-epimerase family protein [Bradyrhizobium sp.]|uniref:aldose 1-epimerase family protein n=1 Tax=Bradyrhizobium sp. TaxID=376 RepID=UPI002D7EA004|nr:aldose 1-epimerase family protein [Bradyrhizobium sp.]HET7887634.1 aldose 1-epimerase family protein [Bradyrhizobium sp.]
MDHTLASGRISAIIKADGAELCSLKNAAGHELLWQAGPAWPRHSPILFPIVGRLKNDELRHRGKAYPMTQHGFARDMPFAWRERTKTSCTLELTDDAASRQRFPFAFRLAIRYAVNDADLDVRFEISNTGDETLPASLGGHPAFNWPLLPELPKEAYAIHFSNDEPAPIRRLKGGLLREKPEPTPIEGKFLALSERLFADDALILDRPASSSIRYAADRGPSIGLHWQGFQQLGIWSKPDGAPFLCLEPWRGFASPLDFDGEFSDKPGIMKTEPGETEILSYRISVG